MKEPGKSQNKNWNKVNFRERHLAGTAGRAASESSW
jgi:hypothetical protein